MKRPACNDFIVRKRCRYASLPSSTPNINRGRERLQPAFISSPPSPSHASISLGLAQSLDARLAEGVRSISDWAGSVPGNHTDSDSFDSTDAKGSNVHAPHGSPPLSNPSSQMQALTENALGLLQQSLIKHKTKSCFAEYHLEEMAAPPTPRSTSSHNRGRTRRTARSVKSRTPSPSKKLSPQTCRTRNMYHANVKVENLDKLPPTIDDEVRRILGIESWEDPLEAPADEQLLHDAAVSYRAESLQNTRDCALESESKASLFQLVRQLSNLSAGELKAHMSEKVWNSALKPTSPPFADIDDEDDSGTRTPCFAQPALPTFDPANAAAAAAAFIRSAPSLPPSTVATSDTEAADPYYISTPKPDITVGLAHTGFVQHHQWCLVDHQASGSILSDPHAADMGIRFPFLIVEVKGLSLNGSLVSAQNQAAISGACMLAILQDLHNQANGYTTSALDSRSTSQEISLLCFSIVTAGPTHEMFVHFMLDGTLHMHCFRSCRTTLRRDTWEFVCFVFQILKWGRGAYKNGIWRS